MSEGVPDAIPGDVAEPMGASGTARAGRGYRVQRVARSGLVLAAERLVSAVVAEPGEVRSAAQRFLAAATDHKIDLTGMHASFGVEGEQRVPMPRQVCLAVPGSGRTATFFTTTPKDEGEKDELGAVIDASCSALTNTRLAQALLTPEEDSVRSAFVGAGFMEICELAYLSGPMHSALDEARRIAGKGTEWPEGIEVVSCVGLGDGELIAALRESYVDTLDCPELCRLRATEDVLRSHKDAGRFDPELWWLVREHGRASGAAFLSRMAGHSAIELVYLGLGPGLRGRGLGCRLLAHALVRLSRVPERDFQCAVDLRNTPALRLYAGFGLRETARRRALVRPLG